MLLGGEARGGRGDPEGAGKTALAEQEDVEDEDEDAPLRRKRKTQQLKGRTNKKRA